MIARAIRGGPELRWMRAADISAVAEMERAAYEFPWTAGIFRDCLRVGYDCRVLEGDGGALQGYVILSVAAAEAHLLNLCVHPDRRRCGLGRDMLRHALTQARIAGAERMFLEVRPSNLAALALYEDEGFVHIGNRPRYYRSRIGREDAAILARELGET
jgi:ribosomal-protein-alanine N-acetyltransferase